MTKEQREHLSIVLEETWMREHSADEAFEMIEDMIFDIIAAAKREVE